jgi:hypothetical protein
VSISVIFDTNVFLHGPPIGDMPWNEFGTEDVDLLLVDRVIEELDHWKDQGNDRRARRARALIPALRRLVDDPSGVVISKGPPLVRLCALPRREFVARATDPDAAIIDDAIRAQSERGKTLLVTRDVLMALRAKRAGIEARLLGSEDVDWNASPEHEKNEMRELRAKLAEYESQAPKFNAEIQSKGAEIALTHLNIFQPQIETWETAGIATRWAKKYFAENPKVCSADQFDVDDTDWHAKLHQIDSRVVLGIAKRVLGGAIFTLIVHNDGTVNANDVKLELMAEGPWQLAVDLPILRIDVPRPPPKRDPLEDKFGFEYRLPDIHDLNLPDFNVGRPDPSEPIWETTEGGSALGCQRLVARIPVLRHRASANLTFRLGAQKRTDDSASELGKLIVRISADGAVKSYHATFSVSRTLETLSLTQIADLLVARGELVFALSK